jgi:hypothetical protein
LGVFVVHVQIFFLRPKMIQLYLTRRNLLTLLSKLDRNKILRTASACTILKRDTQHPKYPLKEPIAITALENADYYTDREPGKVHPEDEPKEPS